jgi:hypothetical protein
MDQLGELGPSIPKRVEVQPDHARQNAGLFWSKV